MAERLFAHLAKERGLPHATLSMGTLGIQRSRASNHAIDVMRERGVDLTAHRSQGLSRGILSKATHIWALEQHHADAVLSLAPDLRPRVALLGKFTGPPDGILDPVNQDREVFVRCAIRIEASLNAWLDSEAK
ncbi:MAG: protein-tyrosine phosphatase [Flavobacteriales bacterium]|jgi:protein-tyrosine phosphatase